MFELFKSQRRARLRVQPFPSTWRAIVDANAPYVATLSPEDRAEIEGHVQVFLAEKKFEGCAGLKITDEIRVTIAAQACRLLLRRTTDYFADLEVILVYPHAYIAQTSTQVGGGVALSHEQARLGQSAPGMVVLAWDAVRHGAVDAHDGHNVTLHEFAHQLDQANGATDRSPALGRRATYTAWAHVFGGEFAHLVNDVQKHRKSDIDEYGATSPGEFFAVVTELFFEKPEALQRRHPQLYEQLAAFYHQDPAVRSEFAFSDERKGRSTS